MNNFITALIIFILGILAYVYIAFPIRNYLCHLDGMRASYYNYGCVIDREQHKELANDIRKP